MNHERMTIYGLTNLKGGSGKTTSTAGLAEALARKGYNVLMVDLDPQATLSRWVASASEGATSLLSGSFSGEQMVSVELDADGQIDVITSNRSLAKMEDRHATQLASRLESLWGAASGYDFALVDPPPSVGALVLATLMASDGVLCPVEAGPGAVAGLEDTMQLIRRTGGAGVVGAFACRVDIRTKSDRQIPDLLTRELGSITEGGRAFDTFIREAVAVREAQTAGKLPGAYDSSMTSVDDYSHLADEVLTVTVDL